MITHNNLIRKMVLVSLLVLLFVPQAFHAHAQATSTGPTVSYDAPLKVEGRASDAGGSRCSVYPSTWPTCILIAFSYPIGLFIAVAAWLIKWGLVINSGLAYTELVKSGFGVTLGVANLGFVLAIIVIAVATIIGYESYGMKKNLWKLIVAALLVNFSLVICSVIISFFDQFAYYFANQMGNQGGGWSGVSDQLVNAFQLNKLASWPLSSVAAFFPVLIFILIAESIIAFTLLAVAISLIVRFFYLAILMILMPLVWLAWVIPGMQKHWSSWWEKFIQWAMSPALLLTFMYIALSIMTSSASNTTFKGWLEASKGGPGEVIESATRGASGPDGLLLTFSKMFIGIALIWASIIAANSLGAKGAGTVVGWGDKAGKAAKNRAILFGKRARTYPLRTPRGRSATERLQTIGNQSNAFLRTISAPVRMAGTALSKERMAAEKTLHDSEKEYKDLSLVEQARRYGSTRIEDSASRFSILHNIHKATEEGEKKVHALEEKKKGIITRQRKAAEERTAASTNYGVDSNQYRAADKKLETLEDEYKETTKAITKAHEEVLKTKKVLDLLPKNAREDFNTFEHLSSLPGGVGDRVKHTNTKYGRMFILYGEHEKKHKKEELDQIKEIIKKAESEHGDDHGGGNAHAAGATHDTETEAHH